MHCLSHFKAMDPEETIPPFSINLGLDFTKKEDLNTGCFAVGLFKVDFSVASSIRELSTS